MRLDEMKAPKGKEKRVLYTGLTPPHDLPFLVHCPLIQIVPRPFDAFPICRAFDDIPLYTHLLFTSKIGVELFSDCLIHYGYTLKDLGEKRVWAIGKMTAKRAREKGIAVTAIAEEETQEAMINMIAMQNLDGAYLFLPQSSRARALLPHDLMAKKIRHQLCFLYDTVTKIPEQKIDLDTIDEIIFTSPSTVQAFLEVFGAIPPGKKITPIGPITQRALSALSSYTQATSICKKISTSLRQ